MDILPQDVAVELLSIVGILGSAWLVSNVLSTNERSLFDRIFKRYKKINNIYQLLPILQKNSKRLFLFFNDLTTSIKSVLTPNDASITKAMVENILSHEYYKKKIIQVQNEVFKEYNVDYHEVENAIKRFSQDDQVEFYVSGVMRMYESVLNCTYPQCPGVVPNREITLTKYFEIIEKIIVSESKRWIRGQSGNIGYMNAADYYSAAEPTQGKIITRLDTEASTRLNSSISLGERSISNLSADSFPTEDVLDAYARVKPLNKANSKPKSNSTVNGKAAPSRLSTRRFMPKFISNTVNGHAQTDVLRENREFQSIIVKEMSRFGYDNYLDAMVALKTSENYFYYFPNFSSSKLAITSKVRGAYSSNDVQKVSTQELELILETSEHDTHVLVLIFDDLIHEDSFNRLVTVSRSERPLEELTRQFDMNCNTQTDLNKNGKLSRSDKKNGSATDSKDMDRSADALKDLDSENKLEDTADSNERKADDEDRNNKTEENQANDKENANKANKEKGILKFRKNSKEKKEVDLNNLKGQENQDLIDQNRKVVTLWLFKEEFLTHLKMQTYPALAIYKGGTVESIKSL